MTHLYLVRCERASGSDYECDYECDSMLAAVCRVYLHSLGGHYPYVSHGDGTWLNAAERDLFGRMIRRLRDIQLFAA